MDVDNDSILTSKWTWIAVLTAFALLSLAVVYAFSTHRPPQIGADERLLSLREPQQGLEASPYAYPPPKIDYEPWTNDKAKPAPKPKPQAVKTAQEAAKPEPKAPKQQVSDMFPMGKVAEQPTAGPMSSGNSRPEEAFPSVTCVGKKWRSTGSFAAASQLDLVPSSCSLGGRTLYALAGSGDNPGVLFAQSLNDPDRYAVYR